MDQDMESKRIAILGSTGSIGTQTLEIVRTNPELRVAALAAGTNVELMEAQIREFHPLTVCMWSEKAAAELALRTADMPVRIVCGMDGLLEIAAMPEADILVTAIVGMIGIRPTIEAIKAHKTIALANKETLVTAGHLIMPLAKECGVSILPVDSEHSAIFQSMQGQPRARVQKILLTASGGPFRRKTRQQLEPMTVEDALKHPNWSMGAKITIDSATMINKAFEIIEARWLFGVEKERITALVHPQSIIHSMVEFVDGAVKAQLGVPDMRLPIRYALGDATRLQTSDSPLTLEKLASLTFERPDEERFPGIKLGHYALEKGGTTACVINAANEVAVAAFLREKIRFKDIYNFITKALDAMPFVAGPTLDDYVALNAETRRFVESLVHGI